MWDKTDKSARPDWATLSGYVNNTVWDRLRDFMEQEYQTPPLLEYSACSMLRGWNVKYRKSGQALCTVYPMDGFFSALVTVGPDQMEGAEAMMPACTDYVRAKFRETELHRGMKWLMLDIADEETLSDLLALVALRRPPKKLAGRSPKVS